MANPSSRPTVAEVLYSADLTFVGNTVRAGAPKLVLPAHVTQAPLIDLRPHYAATASGQRFLLRQPDGLPGPAVKVILNWPAQLRAP